MNNILKTIVVLLATVATRCNAKCTEESIIFPLPYTTVCIVCPIGDVSMSVSWSQFDFSRHIDRVISPNVSNGYVLGEYNHKHSLTITNITSLDGGGYACTVGDINQFGVVHILPTKKDEYILPDSITCTIDFPNAIIEHYTWYESPYGIESQDDEIVLDQSTNPSDDDLVLSDDRSTITFALDYRRNARYTCVKLILFDDGTSMSEFQIFDVVRDIQTQISPPPTIV